MSGAVCDEDDGFSIGFLPCIAHSHTAFVSRISFGRGACTDANSARRSISASFCSSLSEWLCSGEEEDDVFVLCVMDDDEVVLSDG